jgi:hypothetical protein
MVQVLTMASSADEIIIEDGLHHITSERILAVLQKVALEHWAVYDVV